MNQFDRLSLSQNPPYDALQSFVRDNHIAIEGLNEGQLKKTIDLPRKMFLELKDQHGAMVILSG